jgi:hypothetical protein
MLDLINMTKKEVNHIKVARSTSMQYFNIIREKFFAIYFSDTDSINQIVSRNFTPDT